MIVVTTSLVTAKRGSVASESIIIGNVAGSTKNATVENASVNHAAGRVARRQYIPAQNGAAKMIGSSTAILNCSKMFKKHSEITTPAAMTSTPTIRPTRMHCFSPASGLT